MLDFKPIKVDEGLFRGPRPNEADYIELRMDYGIMSSLDLEGPWLDRLEEDRCLELGILPMSVPMSSVIRPELQKVHMAISFIQAGRRPLYVHCHQGVDRTGIVIAAYRVWVQKWTMQQAWDEMMAMGFHRFRYIFWLSRIRRILES